jgi:hypothetical protein
MLPSYTNTNAHFVNKKVYSFINLYPYLIQYTETLYLRSALNYFVIYCTISCITYAYLKFCCS